MCKRDTSLPKTTDADNNDHYTIGVIPLQVITPAIDWSTKDDYLGKDMRIDVTTLVTGTATSMDVYFISGQDGVLNVDNTTGNLIVVYFDPTLDYKNTAEDITNGDYWGSCWDNDGPAVDWGTPAQFTQVAYYNGVDTNKMELIALPVGTDAKDTIGFIVHDGDAKKNANDINIDVTGIKRSGNKIVFYKAGNADIETDSATFIDDAFTFNFIPFTLSTLAGTYSPTPNLIKVAFNQDIKINETDGDGNVTTVFQPSFFTLKEGDTVIPAANYEIKYLNTTTVCTFAIQLKDGHELDDTKTYTLSYDNGLTGTDQLQASTVVDLDTQAPVIQIVGDSAVTITQGAEFTGFPDFVASDDRDGTITNKVYVPSDKGTLDTAN